MAVKPWSEEARVAEFASRKEAERLAWTPVGKSELDRCASSQRMKGMDSLREGDWWSKILEVQVDGFVNWRENPYKMYRGRGLGFMRASEAAGGWADRVQMPVQRLTVTVDRMVQRQKASTELSREVEGLSSWG